MEDAVTKNKNSPSLSFTRKRKIRSIFRKNGLERRIWMRQPAMS
jgi:hypothetical protein